MIKDNIEKDLKNALLTKDKFRVEVLRGLKSAILYEEVAQNNRQTGLDNEAVQIVLARESKKRSESADMYTKAGAPDRAQKELDEKEIIQSYLPEQLSDEELELIVKEVSSDLGANAHMGQIISAVKQKVGQRADGSRIAAMVKANT